ncbi:hypothetical protein BGW38_004107 [Lunasporangiospora selenospora]|uniref:Protein kinase domain-containing protein n=1 Tax=Lunasporangiospora selenospora TaxID=979761 RepID=A0A9P6KBS0_9FUNG|nr:hypothetical protein BGW38_004107 [Lunasporangiospora selenospora]
MERISSSGSVKRPSSVHSGSGYISTSPIGSLAPVPTGPHDDGFSNNPEDYDIRQAIGYGSSAVVYNAYYKPLNKRVAIKVIDLDMFERNQIDELRRETQVMALCKHPNVLRVNGAFVADSKLNIVTPYLSAGSCLDIMKTAHPDGLDEISIATILKQALQGLDYLHKNGHIHRDVKAGNLLVDEDGMVMLADFGVSSSLMENGDRRGMRKTFVGTPCWMAPEVMEQAGYDYKADIWSFGITAIELATGHAPFAKYPPIKVLMLTLSNDPPTLDRENTKHRYSKLLKEMIDSCLQKDPSRRPSAEKLLNHSFFKQAKKKAHLVTGLLHNLPPLEQRPPKKAAPKAALPQKGVSWDFDADDSSPSEEIPQKSEVDSMHRPRTVTFDTSEASNPLPETTAHYGTSDNLVENGLSLQPTSSLSSQGSDKPIKKSRFVIEESVSPAVLSPNPGYSTELSPSSTGPVSPAPTALSPNTSLSGQNLHGLGVTAHVGDGVAAAEVKKGRFSVKDTTVSMPSPVLASIKVAEKESQPSPSRSLSSSPIEGAHDGTQAGVQLEQQQGQAERKSRFEVHHSHIPSVPSNGVNIGSPVLTASQSPHDVVSAAISGLNSSIGTPNPSQGKRSRFQVSNVEGRPTDAATAEVSCSPNSTPNTSPSGSLLRGQGPLIEAQGIHSVHAHLDTLYRQNEQQRAIISELFAGLGLKAGSETMQSTTPASSTGTMGSSGSTHRQDGAMPLEKQLQLTIRENDSLRRENDALKRELDRLRRGL